MSVAVDIAALSERLAEYGERAYLVTVGDDGSPHVVSVEVAARRGAPRGPGRQPHRRQPQRPSRGHAPVAPTADGVYSLLVDATATPPVAAGACTLRPDAAVLHRVAGAAGDGPTCAPLEAS